MHSTLVAAFLLGVLITMVSFTKRQTYGLAISFTGDSSANFRKNTISPNYSSYLARWLPTLYYLMRGPKILLQTYTTGVAFVVATPGAHYVHFSSDAHIRELKEAPSEVLSLHALSKDMFLPQYTMNGLEVHDTMSGNGNLHTRVFRVILSSHLPALCCPLARVITEFFTQEFHAAKHSSDLVHMPGFSMAKRVMTATSALVFFGPKLAADSEFLKAALAYPEDLFFTAEILRLTPACLHSILAPLLMRNHRASSTLVKYLTPVVKVRLARSRDADTGLSNHEQTKEIDCIQFFVDVNSHKDVWTAEKIVQVLLGTWFAAIHQPALTLVYALQDLCDHEEYVPLLQEELARGQYFDPLGQVSEAHLASLIDNTPLLDAFLKESSRLHPSDAISVRRKVLKDFTFTDGTQLYPGDVACVPSQAIMRDETWYAESKTFSPSRFLFNESDMKEAPCSHYRTRNSFTDTDIAYPFWGLGRHSCPGRFYASCVLKLVVAHVLTHYDISSNCTSDSGQWTYRSSILPTSTFAIRKRKM